MDYSTAINTLTETCSDVVRERFDEYRTAHDQDNHLPFYAWYLRRLMDRQNVTTSAAVAALGVSRQFYHRLLSGESKLSDEMIGTISDEFDCTVEELVAVRAISQLQELSDA